jgi:hypothetical protein
MALTTKYIILPRCATTNTSEDRYNHNGGDEDIFPVFLPFEGSTSSLETCGDTKSTNITKAHLILLVVTPQRRNTIHKDITPMVLKATTETFTSKIVAISTPQLETPNTT